MRQPLDTRVNLYGEQRLSDAQVRALRSAADRGLDCSRVGWSAGTFIVHDATVRFLRNQHLVLVCPDEQHVTATQRGRELLARIDAASQGEAA